jgi:hypothetical protein
MCPPLEHYKEHWMSIDASEPHTLPEPEKRSQNIQEEVVPPLPLGASPEHDGERSGREPGKLDGSALDSIRSINGIPWCENYEPKEVPLDSTLGILSFELKVQAFAEIQRAEEIAKQSTKQSARGKRSGTVRRENRQWVKHAEELAKEIRKERPRLSQADVATEIEARWKLNKIKCPSHPTLVTHIREMEKTSDLPRRRVKQRNRFK